MNTNLAEVFIPVRTTWLSTNNPGSAPLPFEMGQIWPVLLFCLTRLTVTKGFLNRAVLKGLGCLPGVDVWLGDTSGPGWARLQGGGRYRRRRRAAPREQCLVWNALFSLHEKKSLSAWHLLHDHRSINAPTINYAVT